MEIKLISEKELKEFVKNANKVDLAQKIWTTRQTLHRFLNGGNVTFDFIKALNSHYSEICKKDLTE